MKHPKGFLYVFCAAVLILSFSVVASASECGIVKEGLTMKSAILKKDVHYTIYLPPNYDLSSQRYPIVYLMHGGADQAHPDWYVKGQAGQTMDRLIADGTVPPMIVVTPDGRRDDTLKNNAYQMNDADGGFLWEDMFIKEFITHIESTYRVAGQPGQGKVFRSVAGLSMGGFGAIIYAWRYPDLFRSAAGLSSGIRTEEEVMALDQKGYDRRYGKAWGMGLEGQARINDKFRQNYPIDMAKKIDAAILSKTRLYIDVGSDDRHLPANYEIHKILLERKIPHIFMVRPGAHDWKYWRTGLPGALKFIAEGFYN